MKYGFRLLFATVAFAATAVAENDVRLVTPKQSAPRGVNVREKPSLRDGRIIGVIPSGHRLRLQGRVGAGWFRVTLRDGRTGFASAEWLDAISAEDVPFEVHFIDVGTGDAAIINIGPTNIVIDGGENPEFLAAYVRKRGLLRGDVDLVIVSHPEIDHYRGLNTFFRRRAPRVVELWDPGVDACPGDREGYDAFLGRVKRSMTKLRRPLYACGQPKPTYEDVPSVPEAQISVLHGGWCDQIDCRGDVGVDNSAIVTRIRIGSTVLLFTGDIHGKGRTDLANFRPHFVEGLLLKNRGFLRADVLKVANHGSETSSTNDFIKAVRPRFAVISADTKHFLPDDSVVQRLAASGAKVLRTDVDRRRGNDHILCMKERGLAIVCNYEDIMTE